MNQRQTTGLEPHRCILDALQLATQRFRDASPPDAWVPALLECLAGAVGADRAAVFANREDGETGLSAAARWGWIAPDLPPVPIEFGLFPIPYDLLEPSGGGGLRSVLASGEPAIAAVPDLPEPLCSIMRRLQFATVVAAPIRVCGTWWGFLGLNFPGEPRCWSDEDRERLRLMAEVVGTALGMHLALESSAQTALRLRTTFDGMGSGVLVTDPAGNIVLANPAAVQCLQLPPASSLVGESLARVAPALEWQMRSVRNENEQRQFLLTLPDGTRRTVGFSTTVSPDRLRTTVLRDLTTTVELEQRRKRAEELAQVGEMAARLAHEIKNPLASVLAGLQLLQREAILSSSHGEVLHGVIAEVRHLSRTIRELLAAARPTAMAPEPTELGRALSEAVLPLHDFAAARRVALRLDPGPADAMPAVDPVGFRRVIVNLVVNAVEAVGPGGAVEVGARELERAEVDRLFPGFGGRVVSIRVADDGPGIRPDRLETIFQPFFTTKTSGTGLGLTVTLETVKAHGGVIRVTSAPGRGAAFEVLLVASPPGPCWSVGDKGCRDCPPDCVVRDEATGHCCWAIKGEGLMAAEGRWPDDCRACALFRAASLQAWCDTLVIVRGREADG